MAEIGVRPGQRVQKKRNLGSQARSRASFQPGQSEGSLAITALTAFAGVAGDAFTARTKKKVEADKAVQTSRALQGFAPTDDATIAGYDAHVAVNIKEQTLASQARLNELAKTRVSEDEWDEAIRKEYEGLDLTLSDDYERYTTSIDLQKLSSVAMREAIAKPTVIRETFKIQHEIEDRMNTATDTLMNNAAANPSSNVLDETNTMLEALKLTESQKDKVILDAIYNTRDQNLIDLSKEYKGERDTSLYERNGKIQQIEKNLKNQAIADKAIQINEERNTLDQSYIDGSMTREQWIQAHVNRNKDLDGKFSTPSHINSVDAAKDKVTVQQFKTNNITKNLLDWNFTDFSQYKPEDVQKAMDNILTVNTDQMVFEANKLPVEDRAEYIDNKQRATIKHYGDLGVKSGMTVDAWTSDLNALSKMVVPSEILESEGGELSITASRGMKVLDSLSLTARDEYLQKLGKQERTTLQNFMHYRDMQMPLTQALDRAQTEARNPSKLNTETINKAVDAIRSEEEAWFRPDFSSAQDAYLMDEVRQKTMAGRADSEAYQKVVSNWMKSQWTITGNMRLKGSPQQLTDLSGLHSEKLGNAIGGYIIANQDTIKDQISGFGFGLDDVFAVTDPTNGTFEIRTKDNVAIPGTRSSLQDLQKYNADLKVHVERRKQKLAAKEVTKLLKDDRTATFEAELEAEKDRLREEGYLID